MSLMNKLTTLSFTPRHTVLANTSPFTARAQIAALSNWGYDVRLQYTALGRADYADVMAEAYAARFGETPVALYDIDWTNRAGLGSAGTPVANGTGQVGAQFSVRGFPANTLVLNALDYLSIAYPARGANARVLHQTVASVVSNGSGVATIPLLQPLRYAPADGAAVNVVNPSGLFTITDYTQEADVNGYRTLTVSAVEYVP